MAELFGGGFIIVLIVIGISLFLNLVPIGLWISAAAWRVRKDGSEYKRTSRLSALARLRNSNLGRLAGIEQNLEGLIRNSLESDQAKALLLRNVNYTMQAVRAQIEYEWRLKRKEELDKQAPKE